MGRRYAVIVVDMLNDFVTGSLVSERVGLIVPKIKSIADNARKNGIPVFYVNDSHIKGEDRELALWGDHAIEGTEGAQVIDNLRPASENEIVTKRTYSGFYETDLEEKLRKEDVDTLIFTGIHAHICVQITVNDAYTRGYDIILAEDAISAFTEDDYRKGMEYMKTIYGSKIMSEKEIVELMSK